MTIDISNNNPRASYAVAQGATQTSFTVNFEFFENADLNVYVDGTKKTLTAHYTVSGGSGSTGTVTMSVTGATGGSTVVITRDTTIERTTDFSAGADINRAALNTQLDTLTAMVADIEDQASRAIQVSDHETAPSLELPSLDSRKGTVMGFNASTGAVEAGPKIADVSTLAAVTADIATLADIEDGTDATDAIQTAASNSSNITTVAGISGNVTTVAGIASNVTSVAGNATNINTVAGDTADINALAGKTTELGLLGTSDAVSDMNTLGTSDVVSDMNTLGTSSNVTNMDTLAGISSNITTVAGVASNVTTVAGSISNVNTTASNISSVNTNATNISAIQGASGNASTATTKASEAATSATGAAASATSAATAQTAAEAARDSALASLDSFDDRYLGAKSSAPSVDNDGNALASGALYYDTTANAMQVYTGSAWVAAYASLSGALLVTNNLSDLNNAATSATNLGLGTGNTPTFNGVNTTGDISFGDSDVAKFGASNDLQIFHDSNNSHIVDSGTGDLFVKNDSTTYFMNAAGTEYKAYMQSNGGCALYFDNSKKFETSAVGSKTDQLFGISDADTGIALGANGSDIMQFYTGNNERMRLSSDGNLGVGTSSPNQALEISKTNGGAVIRLNNPDATVSAGESLGRIEWQSNDASNPGGTGTQAIINVIDSDTYGTSYDMTFATSVSGTTAERMRIDSSGNVGIGTSSPDALAHIYSGASGVTNPHSYTKLHVESADHAAIQLSGSSGGEQWIWFADDTTATPVGGLTYYHGGNYMGFRVNSAERARIDSSGNLLVGKSSTGIGTVGAELKSTGELVATVSNDACAFLNRKSSDGDIVQLRKDGSTVGSIGTDNGGDLYLGNSATGLLFAGGSQAILPWNPSGPTSQDDYVNLGLSNHRFDNIYATNGTIQTSDRNEKQDIASLTDAEITAAKSISKLFKTFKWKDKVASKGDAARTHTGVIAQEVEAAMSDAGLDAGNYAFFISTTWWETSTEVAAVEADEENGIEAQEAYTRIDTFATADEAPEGATERNRKGIRYPELLSFIGAATEQRLTNIETRLDALEAE